MDVRISHSIPFLKWAGGKRWLADHHLDKFPTFSGKYIEPFLGSASIFFKIQPASAILSDANSQLIECYQQIRNHPLEIFSQLAHHQTLHSEDYYYSIRAGKYNTPQERAAQFIYLNRTCWNGLYRVNKNGQFNVPIGTKSSVLLPSDDFVSISQKLKKAVISCGDFEEAINQASYGDLVYADPPYTIEHNNTGFIKYNENTFSWSDQIRLRDCIVAASNRGAKIVVSNTVHESLIQLYSGLGQMHIIERNSVLAAASKNRGKIGEILVIIEAPNG